MTIDVEYTGSAIDPFGNQRIDWGVTWNAALEAGGVLVSEKVSIEFEISAVRSAA